MNNANQKLSRTWRWLITCAGFLALPMSLAPGQSVQHLNMTVEGGIPGQPTVTGVIPWTNGASVTWDGPAGYYQLLEKHSLTDATWRVLGPRTNLTRRAWVPGTNSNALFRVYGPAPHYVGAQTCQECHQAIHDTVSGTAHAQAFNALTQIGQDKNPDCLHCHTVGYGNPSGFTSASATPQLEGVQCENCHGPAGNHAANPDDPTSRPRVEIAATMCGGCHTGDHQPTYAEWKSSAHSGVVEDMNPTNRIDSCGRCHSGSARWTMLEGRPLPVGDANLGIQCINCHEPHSRTGHPYQLYNPVASTNDYVIKTSGTLVDQYNQDINVCAQCHNHRGADWRSTSRAPHHSPQYNMLIGTVGLLDSGAAPHQPATHALGITNQCAGCHMQKTGYSLNQPAVTGHAFEVQSYNACIPCHETYGEQLAQLTTSNMSNWVQTVKAKLDFWAMTKSPDTLRTNYGSRAWEYTNPGDLSPGGSGPSSSEQSLIPVNIQKARFNLYLVLYDGSFGVHNAPFAQTLMSTAENWVDEELSQ